ncbi:hypothetical protein DEO72_LG10g2807 [Vigna unguiculata]|uniref:Uncharacterized protein n=1 Tax=Vigna unguiculata TaxID=3917 RepID=A0A4D6NFT2_VIGUN|nr:hypothetical protein DEO72_LG2g3081 [Vigna unguiculata]QCE11574.1 hypothetical protein DEO72_LG10g2807 [Vigna unguiculata]
MGSIKRERRVLKLVHPGKHVEVHRKPVRAEEVMRKNPRHCITRPDVFKFPWIVVKPESVLLPGSVFLIVPHHTIYDLLKASTTQSISISIQSQLQTQNLPLTNHMHNQLKPEACDDGMSFSPQMLNQSIKVSPFEFRTYYKALKYYEEYYHSMHMGAEMVDLKNGVNLEFVSSEHGVCNITTGLKSCLRRPNSMRKNLKLKVSFNVEIKKQ